MTSAHNRHLISKPFSYFDQRGECLFPSTELIRTNAERGIVTALVLDANVCLNLSNYARGQRDAEKEAKVRTFLLAIEFAKVDVVPYFGCMELASRRGSDELDQEKLSSITSNVARALSQSESSLARGHQVPRESGDGLAFTDKSLAAYQSMLRYAYCSFLKLFEIRSRGHLKDRAAKNFAEFFDWSEGMECHVGLVSQAAFALFGGAKEADKLLSLGDGKTPLDAAWGAAWDVWHCWIVQNYLPTLRVDGLPQHTIFVTDDAAAAYVAGHCLPRVLLLNGGKPLLSASELSYDFPYYLDKKERLAEMMSSRDAKRHVRVMRNIISPRAFDHARVEAEILRLEQSIMAAHEERAAS